MDVFPNEISNRLLNLVLTHDMFLALLQQLLSLEVIIHDPCVTANIETAHTHSNRLCTVQREWRVACGKTWCWDGDLWKNL